MAQTTLPDAVCLGCGCLCDDILISLDGGRIAKADRACELGQQWFQSLTQGPTAPADPEAINRAVKLLAAARSPLVCGLRGASSDAQRTAVAIADRLGGCVDWTTKQSDAASIIAYQTYGAVGASLGEVAQRADLVIFWQCDPGVTHPRHFDRYSLQPTSPWIPNGRKDRSVVLVGSHDSSSSADADLTIELNGLSDIDALRLVRSHLANTPLEAPPLEDTPSVWSDLADRIRDSRFTAIFYGDQLKQQGHAAIGQLTLLAQATQQSTRLVTLPLGGGDNAPGAESVMTWQTGYPMAVSFAQGFPEYGPDEFTTEAMLANGETDAVLVVSDAGLDGLSDTALQHLRNIPSVVLSAGDASDLNPDVALQVAPLGAKPGGSVYRCDGVALPLENDFAPNAQSCSELLVAIEDHLRSAAEPDASGSTTEAAAQ